MLVDKELKFKPAIDVFASKLHHQLPNYFSRDNKDVYAYGIDAFSQDWSKENLYINPPFKQMNQVVQKLIREKGPSYCTCFTKAKMVPTTY